MPSPSERNVTKLSDCRDNVWTVLTAQPTDHTPSIVLHDVKEIETWILRLLSAPVPIPGSTRIELEVLSPTVHEPLLFSLPDHTRFSLVDFPLHLPLELLGKFENRESSFATCVLIVRLIALRRRRDVPQSADAHPDGEQSAVPVARLQCIINVSHIIRNDDLPARIHVSGDSVAADVHELRRAAAARADAIRNRHPGVVSHVQKEFQVNWHPSHSRRKSNRKFAAAKNRLPDDIWLVDLDSNKLSPPTGYNEEIPALPEPEGTILKNHLKQVNQP